MKQIQNLFQRIGLPVANPEPVPAGIYHYQTAPDAETQYRLHLRVEADGTGLLIVNASTILHLNQTAVDYAYHLIQQKPIDETVRYISARYRVSPEQARQDYTDLKERIHSLVLQPDLDPVSFLDFERETPYSTNLSAPLRVDIALTYRTTDGALDLQASPQDRVRRELLTEEWIKVLQKTWEAGIPHVIFTGGEPTLRPDLVELIQQVERQGQVAGLISDGFRLCETAYLHQLLQSGLDHLMLILKPLEDECWEALRDVLAEDLFTTVHVTVTEPKLEDYIALLTRLKTMGVSSISLSASKAELAETLHSVRDFAAHLGLSLVWDLPVPYSTLHPVALETQAEAPSGAGNAWIYLEPDADVLPYQGAHLVMGNLLEQDWAEINRALPR